jgi:hypothetical protein
MSTAWPPPPDLDSLKELVSAADVEGLILAHGAPADEYDGEAEALFADIAHFPTAQLIPSNLMPILEPIWTTSFGHNEAELAERRPALEGLAQQIARFFGPEATPQVRGA